MGTTPRQRELGCVLGSAERGQSCLRSPVHRRRSLEIRFRSCVRGTAPQTLWHQVVPPQLGIAGSSSPFATARLPTDALFYLFPFSAASKHLRPVAIASPVPAMPSLPTNLPGFSPEGTAWLQPLPVL